MKLYLRAALWAIAAVVIIAALAGCSNYMNPAAYELAIERCKPNDGLRWVKVGIDYVTAFCRNGGEFWIRKIKED